MSNNLKMGGEELLSIVKSLFYEKAFLDNGQVTISLIGDMTFPYNPKIIDAQAWALVLHLKSKGSLEFNGNLVSLIIFGELIPYVSHEPNFIDGMLDITKQLIDSEIKLEVVK